MQADLLNLPDTLDGLATDELLCLPATWEDYLDVLETAPILSNSSTRDYYKSGYPPP